MVSLHFDENECHLTLGQFAMISVEVGTLYCPLHSKKRVCLTRLLTSCNKLLQQADIRMRSHGLRHFLTTSLLQVVNRLVAS